MRVLKSMPSDDTKPDGRGGHLLSVHISHTTLKRINTYSMQRFIDTHPKVRNGKQWDGVGGMIGISEHINYYYFGEHTDFALKPEHRNQLNVNQEEENLLICGKIFENHFKDQG